MTVKRMIKGMFFKNSSFINLIDSILLELVPSYCDV
jgi:hypothetical protein